jgi:hypothetical protein
LWISTNIIQHIMWQSQQFVAKKIKIFLEVKNEYCKRKFKVL